MRVFLISDLHCELGTNPARLTADIDLIILAGDMAHGNDCLDLAKLYRDNSDVPVLVLAGNHEFYRLDIDKTLNELRAEAASTRDIHFLECNTFVLGYVRFLGCTLWSNFSLYGAKTAAHHMQQAGKYVNDFRLIRCGTRLFTPKDALARFNASYTWLEKELAKPFAGKTIVLTHFAPHRAAIHPRYVGPQPDELTPYFTSDCSALMQQYPIDVWMYGHTHNSVDVIVENGVRLISNQRGYPTEPDSYTRFTPEKLIDI